MGETNRRGNNMYGRDTMNAAAAPLHHHHHHHHQTQIDNDDDDDVTAAGGGDNPTSHIRYDHHPHALHNNGGASMDAANAINGVDNALYCPPSDIVTAAAAGGGASDQLTLSFQGEVYVFDAVSPEKVQAVLLLLGGYEVPAGIPTVSVAPQTQRASGDLPGRLNQPQRAASLNRFREKRKERCFDKKIRYTVRKEVAMRMQRKKGQFTSAKSISDEAGSSSADWNEGSGQEEQETSCRHCGISSKSTPMMRRGPAGPRSLCNACGLKWANKGILRDLSKVPTPGAQDQTAKSGEQITGEPNGSDAMAAAAIITPEGDNRVVTAER
ncbi:GATA transcription factor 24-like isoform X1 [Lycium barbarum]|uniref:GATA transcription factor 24-like isoform X1 n=1 Tax=Lycium barbarum TaxID=112863 RepID=UPI00293F3F4E|nr:GATA transcription factor 24-like isoform X1 [Lycium barbarum]